MKSEKMYFDANNSLDIQGIKTLKATSKVNDSHTKHHVAEQFESMLVHMLIKSMREAGKSFSADDEKSDQSGLYQDLFDNQVALLAGRQGVGLSKQIEAYLTSASNPSVDNKAMEKKTVEQPPTPVISTSQFGDHHIGTSGAREIEGFNLGKSPKFESAKGFEDDHAFINHIWGYAKKAAMMLGVDPKLLIAQAVLETGWGKRIISKAEKSTYNLFNIKAGKDWHKVSASVDSLEVKEGVFVKENAVFRAYDSFAESFSDYVQLIQGNPRYKEAVKMAANPEQYMLLLQKAQYATDPHYAEKVLNIYKSDKLNALVDKI